MSTDTSIGPDADKGGNDDAGNADGCGNKTLGDKATQQPPAGAEQPDPRRESDRGRPPGDH